MFLRIPTRTALFKPSIPRVLSQAPLRRSPYSSLSPNPANHPSFFENKVIAISGAGSGMGLALAKVLYPTGARLSLTDQSDSLLANALTSLSSLPSTSPVTDRVITTVADVGDSSQVDTWIGNTVAKWGALDHAANFAGIVNHNYVRISDMSDEGWGKTMNINLTGMFYAVRAQLRAMGTLGKAVEDGQEKGYGKSIVVTSSVSGLVSLGWTPPDYTASKHGVLGLMKAVAREAGPYGIRVNAVAP
ncbi:hypothetical protein NX059_010457 [Plenodomus lindquistii]|nr:hypothetical protein NX059_010457 [Plenodomus lindquistii]